MRLGLRRRGPAEAEAEVEVVVDTAAAVAGSLIIQQEINLLPPKLKLYFGLLAREWK
jgi:hypothetical protein